MTREHTSLDSLTIVFHNANRNPSHMSSLLSSLSRHVDVLCIQEPWYGPLKHIPAPGGKRNVAMPGDRTNDHRYFGTQSDSHWRLFEPSKTDHDNPPRVVCYVNTRLPLTRAFSHLALRHRDAILLGLQLRSSDPPLFLLNVYNDPRGHSAVLTNLISLLPRLPDQVRCVGGDFNLHSPDWDPSWGTSSPRTDLLTLSHLTGAWDLDLRSPVDVPTHFPHNPRLQGSVIDLVWSPRDHPRDSVQVRAAARGLSDHALLYVTLPTDPISLLGPPAISDDDLEDFLTDLAQTLVGFFNSTPRPDSGPDVELYTQALYDSISSTWESHAQPRNLCVRSKPWWNNHRDTPSNTALPKISQLQRLEARRSYFKAIRDAKRAFFEQRIHNVATNNAQVWDLTAWYKPRRSDTADIVDSLGNPILTPEDLRDNAGPTFHSAEVGPRHPY
ncbi:Endonuclease/exonuclease/phosphatase [Dichomitus squalens]|uniref:Endonuclease/exonuclease/phosphatase n=1 Tax=Dichomitus squalens TaxID=114155 RepID=A0A4Q9PU04_9APHY|nr:Endonuclease/exonuclease/phosphatase [Dichomitus squalens]